MNTVIGIILLIGIYIMIVMLLDWMVETAQFFLKDKKKERITHHDNEPYSHFRISSQALKDARKEKYGL